MKPAIFSIAAYAAKMLAMPAGTRFEFRGQKVGRVTYAVKTGKLLWDATHPGRRTLHRRWSMSRLYQKFDGARWHFFGYNPIGAKLLDLADRLHEKHPESSTVHKLWLFCLPF